VTTIRGDFHAPGRSERHPAGLKVDPEGRLSIRCDNCDGPAPTPLDQVEISPRLGNTPRVLRWPDGAQFETTDNDAIDRLMQRFGRHRGYRILHRMERHLPLVLLFTLLVIAFVFVSVEYGIPALSRSVAETLPPEVNRQLGQGSLEVLDKTTFGPSELPPERQRELLALFREYTDRYPQWQIRPLLRKGNSIGPNALALPGGEIIFTDELVELAEDDRELLAILGHEIGHLEKRHLMRRVLQSSMLTVIVISVTGDVSTVSSAVYALPTLLMELQYSRSFETEADDFAYAFLRQNGLKPIHFARIMRRLEREFPDGTDDDSISVYLSTHPPTAERIQRFEQAEEKP